MSSRLLRGEAVPIEPAPWRRVSSSEMIGGENYYPSEPLSEPVAEPSPDCELQVRAAQHKGFEEGQAAARESFAQQAEAMQRTLARAVEELTGLRPRCRREAEQDVVALALAVARRILHRELTVAPDALLGLVKAALDKMESREVQQVRVSRSDAAMVRQFLDQMGLPQRVEVIADANVAPGGATLESSRGILDASVETQLAEIERGFADLVRTHS